MASEYTPTTDEVRFAFIAAAPEALQYTFERQFDRWLAAHDQEVISRARDEAHDQEVREQVAREIEANRAVRTGSQTTGFLFGMDMAARIARGESRG